MAQPKLLFVLATILKKMVGQASEKTPGIKSCTVDDLKTGLPNKKASTGSKAPKAFVKYVFR